MKQIDLLGVPIEFGASQRGTIMGPDAMRTAGIVETLEKLGYSIKDHGNAEPEEVGDLKSPLPHLNNFQELAGWTRSLAKSSYDLAGKDTTPIYLGGDHALSHGTVAGIAKRAKEDGRELYVLWLDAHPDFNTLESTESGNLHGTPAAFFCGLPGFKEILGHELEETVDPKNLCQIGIRSVDDGERKNLVEHDVIVHDMRTIDEHGVAALLAPFLEKVKSKNGLLHVSLDVDFLEPEIAPAVGTTVPGGATFREAHLIMEMLHDSELVTSLDVVELNPFLDDRGQTAQLMVDLTASLFGRHVMDRRTTTRWSR